MRQQEEFLNPVTSQIARFLTGIGIPVRGGEVPASSFLPGLRIDRGALVVDEARLLYPGDLLHEAGHLAVLPPAARAEVVDSPGDDGGLEMAAIAWSYAAALAAGLEPAVVFHPDGYKGGAQALLDNFSQGRYIGVPLLAWMGLTVEPRRAATGGEEPYPQMVGWLRS